MHKKYIYTMYIYSKCDKMCKMGEVCYGYPMGMLWVSYGVGSKMTRCWFEMGSKTIVEWLQNDSRMAVERVWNGGGAAVRNTKYTFLCFLIRNICVCHFFCVTLQPICE